MRRFVRSGTVLPNRAKHHICNDVNLANTENIQKGKGYTVPVIELPEQCAKFI